MTLTPVEPEHHDLAFMATTQDCPWPKAYGGDPVAIAIQRTRPAIERDNSGLMNHLHENRDVPFTLHNLIHVAVAAGQHPARHSASNTAIPWAHMLEGVRNVREVIVSSRLRGRG